jgi:hypothetical protein
MKKISVMGSCVTRDGVEFLEDKKIGLTNYIARSSLVSIVADPLNIAEAEIALDSKFQRQMVEYDLNKRAIAALLNDDSEFLIIDMIDERFDLLKCKNSYITYSNEFSNSGLRDKLKFSRVNKEDKMQLWKESVKIFINRISEKYHPERIIVNKVYYSSEYITLENQVKKFSNQSEIDEKNSFLNEMYEYIKEHFPGVSFIEYEGVYYADEKHKWGLSPFHFEERLYKDFCENLTALVEGCKIFRNEKVFKCSKNIRYIFEEGLFNRDKLVIVFSAFNSNKTSQYNYLRAMGKYDCNKLFILDDYGVGGTYYLGRNGEIESSVSALINHFVAKLNIRLSEVIAIGSSKGGSAALYFGLKYSLGTVISGGFQTRIGDYLSKAAPETMEYMVGEINDASILKLNSLHEKIVQNKNNLTKLYLHGGKGDWHYLKSMKPFINYLEKNEIRYDLDLQDYESHNDVGDHFINYLDLVLSKELYMPGEIVLLKEKDELVCTCPYSSDLQYAFYIFKNGELVDKKWYTPNNILRYKITGLGTYQVAYFMKRNELLRTAKTNVVEINAL